MKPFAILPLVFLLSCDWEANRKQPPTLTARVERVEQEPVQKELTPEELAAAEELAAQLEAERVKREEAIKRADEARKARAKKMFGEVMEPLTEAKEAYDRHDELDESSWFGEDQEDNQERIDELLDEAIEVLGVSEIATTRQDLRRLQKEIKSLEAQVVKDREARLGAPEADDLGTLEKTYKTTREEYDARIAAGEAAITERKHQIAELEYTFVESMQAIGLDLDLDGARSLLSTVNGDDFVEMCVVFDNVRGITEQLEELTNASGESLDAAKRYYGSYVVLIKMMDRIQKDFVRRTREEMMPKLTKYSDKAREIIRDAERNLKNGGNPDIARQNIKSNELTIQATELYTQYLREQANEIEARNKALQVTLKDAENTYDTVSLSSQVAEIMKEGQRNFAALLRLELPALRGFENAELKAEFERLTREMTGVN
jgi:uncharacterized small protein (DUF1192 family)